MGVPTRSTRPFIIHAQFVSTQSSIQQLLMIPSVSNALVTGPRSFRDLPKIINS